MPADYLRILGIALPAVTRLAGKVPRGAKSQNGKEIAIPHRGSRTSFRRPAKLSESEFSHNIGAPKDVGKDLSSVKTLPSKRVGGSLH